MSRPAPMPLLLATVFFFNLIEFLQSGMLVFATAPLMGAVHASPEEYGTITAAYAAAAILATSQMSALVQRFGWRRYLLASLAVFGLGAGVCAVSHDLMVFGIGRIVMGLGGGAFMSSARMIIHLIPPGPQRIKGIAAFGSALAIGMATGPWLAAEAIAHDYWQGMFFALLAIGCLAAALATCVLPDDAGSLGANPAGTHFSPAWLLALGAFSTLNGIQRAVYDFHAEAAPLILWLTAGAGCLVWFIHLESASSAPFLRLRSLANRRFLFGLGIFTVCYIVLGATNVMLPVFIQRGLGVPLEVAGRAQALGLVGALLAFIGMILVVRTRPAAKKFYVTAFFLLAIFAGSLSRLNGQANVWRDVVPPLALFGGFLILAMATTALHAFRQLQQNEVVFANAQQAKNMLSQFGLGFGVVLANVGFQSRVTQHYSILGERVAAGGDLWLRSLDQATSALSGSTAPAQSAMAQLAQQLVQQSVTISSLEYFHALMWVALIAGIVMLAQRIFD